MEHLSEFNDTANTSNMETKVISVGNIVSFCNNYKSLSYMVVFFLITNVLAMFSTVFEAPCVSCTVTRTLSGFGGCSYDPVPFTFNSLKVWFVDFLKYRCFTVAVLL